MLDALNVIAQVHTTVQSKEAPISVPNPFHFPVILFLAYQRVLYPPLFFFQRWTAWFLGIFLGSLNWVSCVFHFQLTQSILDSQYGAESESWRVIGERETASSKYNFSILRIYFLFFIYFVPF